MVTQDFQEPIEHVTQKIMKIADRLTLEKGDRMVTPVIPLGCQRAGPIWEDLPSEDLHDKVNLVADVRYQLVRW